MFKIFNRFLWTIENIEKQRLIKLKSTRTDQDYKFPNVWLRDNCQCKQCFSHQSKSRIMDLRTNLKVRPIDVRIIKAVGKRDAGKIYDAENITLKDSNMTEKYVYKLKIKWEDAHESEYNINWLLERNFSKQNRHKHWETYRLSQRPWTSHQFQQLCRNFTFEDILTKDRVLLEWLTELATIGVAIIDNAGVNVGTLKDLAKRIGFLKRTQYGETFRVEYKPGTSNVAYLNSKLQLHTDLPYYEYKPGINLLHCIIQAQHESQGVNQLTDCLAICQYLRTNRSQVYEILKSTLVDWSDYGEDNQYRFCNIYRAPVICENALGEITRINFSQPQRDSVFNVPIDLVEPWYESMSVFTHLLHDPKYLVNLKLTPGQILTFDNVRLVHGRLSYEQERLLEGGYLDWDLVRSRIRVLTDELNLTQLSA